MPRIQRWSPDTCGCRGLWMKVDDDGTVSMVSFAEARRIHQANVDAHVALLQTHGLSIADREKRSAAWTAKMTVARRAERLFDTPVPAELKGGPISMERFDETATPYEICKVHYEMGFPEDDQDDEGQAGEAMHLENPQTSEAFRGLVWGENIAKNQAVAAAVEAAGGSIDDGEAVMGVKWSFAPSRDGQRNVRIEMPEVHRGATLARAALRTGWGVEVVESLEAAAAEDALSK